jgi:hypothetical protein
MRLALCAALAAATAFSTLPASAQSYGRDSRGGYTEEDELDRPRRPRGDRTYDDRGRGGDPRDRSGYGDPRDGRGSEDRRRSGDPRDGRSFDDGGRGQSYEGDRRGRGPDDGGRGRGGRGSDDDAPRSRPGAAVPGAGGGGGGSPLYVGAQPGCNGGVVTVDPGYKGCATTPIGATVGQQSGSAGLLYAGRDGTVTTSPGGQPIGYLVPAQAGGTRLYVGTQPGCNAGVVTNNPSHLNCATAGIGSTAR